MPRLYSQAYLTACALTPPQAIRQAAALGYSDVGLRLWPNVAGAPQQFLIGQPAVLRETLAVQRDTGVGVFDLEIIRIGAGFDPRIYLPLLEAGAALKARALLVAGDDTDEPRLTEAYARLCELVQPYGLTADLEFMPWTAVPDANAALRIVLAAGRPASAGILVDALHFDRSGTTLDDIRALPRDLLHYAQVCDAPTRAQWTPVGRAFTVEEMVHTARCERLQPGEGGIGLQALFSALPNDLPVSVEVVHLQRMAQIPPADWSRQCLAASRNLLDLQATQA
ncbi:Sugar phosphate isomerase/epimerase [Rhodoferax sp. OV413]|uniref:sugar phosphate isomerase/epimerase family protein n=1 Tax=Rhodoferax sp. OV413 TaxID=1855285 RepID=UPI00088D0D73|nr:sugar phosphate isomerase/epimerase [Rhodoferax sp. OV413]SDP15416.1 Sugar phosphate isomerase/epimerase [Rhodoferax sp. OV413]